MVLLQLLIVKSSLGTVDIGVNLEVEKQTRRGATVRTVLKLPIKQKDCFEKMEEDEARSGGASYGFSPRQGEKSFGSSSAVLREMMEHAL